MYRNVLQKYIKTTKIVQKRDLKCHNHYYYYLCCGALDQGFRILLCASSRFNFNYDLIVVWNNALSILSALKTPKVHPQNVF